MQSRKSALRRLASKAKFRWNSARIGYLRREQALLNKQRYFKEYQHNIYLLNRAALKIQHWFINQIQRIAEREQPRPLFSELKKGYFIKAPTQMPWKMSIKSCSTTPKNARQLPIDRTFTPRQRSFTKYDPWSYEESPQGKVQTELNLSFSDKVKMSSNCVMNQVLESLKLGEEIINRSPPRIKQKQPKVQPPPVYEDYKNYKKNKTYALKKFLRSAYKKIELTSFRSPQQPRQIHTPKTAETKRGSLYQEVIGRQKSPSRSKSREKKGLESHSTVKYFSNATHEKQKTGQEKSKSRSFIAKGYSSVGAGVMNIGQSKTPRNQKTNKPLFQLKKNEAARKSVKDLKGCLWAEDLEIETKLNTEETSHQYLQELRARGIDTPSFKDQIPLYSDYLYSRKEQQQGGKFDPRTLIKIANSYVPKKKEVKAVAPAPPVHRERLQSIEDSVLTNYSSHTEGSFDVNQYDSVQTIGSRIEQNHETDPQRAGPKIAEYFSEREVPGLPIHSAKDYESVPCLRKQKKGGLNKEQKQSAWSLVQEFYQIQEYVGGDLPQAASQIQKAWRSRKQRIM